MKKIIHFTIFISLIFIVGCSNSFDYGDDEIAAIVRGEEIKVGELRFLYPDDKILDNLDGTIKAKLAMQEVKKLNIDVSDELQEIQQTKENIGTLPPKDVKRKFAIETREFAEDQAKKLGMEPEEYHVKHYEKTQEMVVYIMAYVEEILGDHEDIETDNAQEWTEDANHLLDNLVKDNKEVIEVFID